MKILIVAATRDEIGPVILNLSKKPQPGTPGAEFQKNNSVVRHPEPEGSVNESEIESTEFEILITGVGMVATAFALGQHLSNNQYDLVMNLGIAGSFNRNIAPGSVVEVFEDTFAELGAEDDMDFLPLSKLGFGEETFKASASLSEYRPGESICRATAITVNTVHGNETSILQVINRLNPQLESMEGAAVFYACQQFGIPCMQIRAVSNYVEKRNRASWQIGLAIKNLNIFAKDLLMTI